MNRDGIRNAILAACVLGAATAPRLAAQPANSPTGGLQPASRPALPATDQLRALVDAVAQGRDPAATDRLLSAWVEPLAAALSDIDSRPREEQLRLLAALQRVHSNLHLQQIRYSLDAEDRARLDRVLQAERPLIESLFHFDERVRLAALERIPLERNTAAGLLIAAKLYDPNAEVVDAALRKARELHDDSVAKGLRRFAREALELISRDQATESPESLIVYATFLDVAAATLAEIGQTVDVPLINDILLRLANPVFQPFAQQTFATIDGLGKLGSESSVPALRAYLAGELMQSLPNAPDGGHIFRTTADAALLALCRIYRLDPLSLGFVQPVADRPEMGFRDIEVRARARLQFEDWFRRNAEKPAAERDPLKPLPPAAPTTRESTR